MPRVGIIGGSFAGLKALSTIFNVCKSPALQVTLIAPSTHAYYNMASPRLLSEPENFEKTVFPIKDFVEEFGLEKGKFVHGSVTNVDLQKREIDVDQVAGGTSKLAYDILVIASGTRAKWAGYKVNTDFEEARREIYAANKGLQEARSVAVVGGGVTGVESAGEIAVEFPQAKVTLYTGASAPLDGIESNLPEKATEQLEELGVEIINNLLTDKVTHKGQGGADTSSIVLTNGEKKEYDVILESYLTGPYSSFLPQSIKDEKGFVRTDGDLLVKGQRGVVALGDIVAGSSKSVVDLKFGQMGIFRDTMEKMFKDIEDPAFLTGAAPESTDSQYVPITHTLVVPISRKGGVGMSFRIPLANFLVWVGKARTFMIEKARAQFL